MRAIPISIRRISATTFTRRTPKYCITLFTRSYISPSSRLSRTFRPAGARSIHPPWQQAGQEPGLDTSIFDAKDRERLPHTECDITIVDYSEDRIESADYDNASLPAWVESHGAREEWVKCRWINVSGLSWDVIQLLGNWKGLHRLAIEDMVNREKRAKVDWYSDHMHIVLTLQKLIHAYNGNLHNSETEGSRNGSASKGPLSRLLDRILQRHHLNHPGAPSVQFLRSVETYYSHSNDGLVVSHTEKNGKDLVQKLRTLQGHRGGSDMGRIAFMEAQSPLTRHGYAVCAEQVSIFLTSDNTVISFFEASANDIEKPILNRLNSKDTILRKSCDASMLVQSIIDTIIDLAVPVTSAYQDAIGRLELDVLTDPNMRHARELYVITSEIAAMQNSITPITALITSLQDSRAGIAAKSGPEGKDMIDVTISPLSKTYLADVKDHCYLIAQNLDQMLHSAQGMIGLIFNTITAHQNESMKKLTGTTIFFLPLSFIASYFGMNLERFPSLNHDEIFFWYIATPVAMATGVMLVWGRFWRLIMKMRLRRSFSKRLSKNPSK